MGSVCDSSARECSICSDCDPTLGQKIGKERIPRVEDIDRIVEARWPWGTNTLQLRNAASQASGRAARDVELGGVVEKLRPPTKAELSKCASSYQQDDDEASAGDMAVCDPREVVDSHEIRSSKRTGSKMASDSHHGKVLDSTWFEFCIAPVMFFFVNACWIQYKMSIEVFLYTLLLTRWRWSGITSSFVLLSLVE